MFKLIKPRYIVREISNIAYREYNPYAKQIAYKPLVTKENFVLDRNIGNPRHFPAAIKEWKNSVYNFNKTSLRNVSSKDVVTNKLIKSYFYFSNLKVRPRSKRMRSLRRKFTSKRLFVSRPEIKQTNDKVIVTIFSFNREKQFLLKKLFYFNRRRAILDLWRKSKNLTPFVEQYKELNFLLLDEKSNKTITKATISDTAKNIIIENKDIYAEFISNLVSKKDKNILYSKIINKVSRNVYRSSVFDKRIGETKNLYFLTNKSKINRYKRGRVKRFKKRIQTTKKVWYIRKKMKRFKPKAPRLTRKQRRLLRKRIIPYSGIKFKNEMNFLSFKLLLKNKRLAYGRKLFYFYFLKYILTMFNIRVYAFKSTNSPSELSMNDIIYTNELLNIEKNTKKNGKGKRNKKNEIWI